MLNIMTRFTYSFSSIHSSIRTYTPMLQSLSDNMNYIDHKYGDIPISSIFFPSFQDDVLHDLITRLIATIKCSKS